MNNTFLVEIGTEELPPKSLRFLAESLTKNFTEQLNSANLTHGNIQWFATPRRIAIKVLNLSDVQPDVEMTQRGPAISAAYDTNGNPTKAALGWASGCGIAMEKAERIKTDKGEWLSYTHLKKGAKTVEILANLVKIALEKLPIPKPMRWAAKRVEFIRPIHTLTMLYGDKLVHGEILEIKSDRVIKGHKFMGEPTITLDHADHYPEILESRGKVIADYDKRKQIILEQAQNAAQKIGGIADLTDSLLEEVVSLVEWPVVLTAKFEEQFLDVPAEALVYTMKGDQKYFPVYASNGKLLPNFIFVSNIESKNPSMVIAGNEKVVRPRLADAKFFYQSDLKEKLEDRLTKLEQVLFQHQLGTLKEKALRLSKLAEKIAESLNANPTSAARAGLLAKCDLVTNVVFEFPDTQGTMGRYLALNDGESADVAQAIDEQYKPKFSGDSIPTNPTSCAVAIAEKLDTLVGIFGIGLLPKGDKDPFALRRASIGILRIIIENDLNLDLLPLIEYSRSLFGDKLTNISVTDDIVQFMQSRFKALYQEQGFSVDTIQSVLAINTTKPADFDARIKAVNHFKTLPEAKSLAEANKRVANILNKNDFELTTIIEPSLLNVAAEIDLNHHINRLLNELSNDFERNDYQSALIKLATLKQPIDDFFENVMIMDENSQIRQNRLALLNQLRQLFWRISDISLLQM